MSDKLKIWVIEVGEPMPLPGTNVRLMRTGQYTERLARLGVDVTWWASDFSHQAKRYYDPSNLRLEEGVLNLANGLSARFLHGRPYARNVGVSRILHNIEEARDFLEKASRLQPPDAIICGYPTIDLAYAATQFGRRHGIPVIVDIRDLWPDVFLDVSPLPRWMTKAIATPVFFRGAAALRAATGLCSITPAILAWGLQKAGRQVGPNDRVSVLAYTAPELTAATIEAGEAFWRACGLRLDGSEYIACFLGNLSTVPELDTVVGAIDHIPSDIRSSMRIVVCGAGERLGWLQGQAVRYPELVAPGRVDAASIAILMKHSFAGLLPYPSRFDLLLSYPNKFGEYVSAGLPVISTLGGMVGELISAENCGIVVPNGNASKFGSALAALVKDPAMREQKSANAKRIFLQMFDAGKVYDEMAEWLIGIAQHCPRQAQIT